MAGRSTRFPTWGYGANQRLIAPVDDSPMIVPKRLPRVTLSPSLCDLGDSDDLAIWVIWAIAPQRFNELKLMN